MANEDHASKNYRTDNGDTLVIGGKLVVKEGAEVTGLVDVALLVPATEATLGGVKAAEKEEGDTVECKIDPVTKKLFTPTYPVVPEAEAQADSTAENVATLVLDFNALLAKLKAAGLMASGGPS